MKDFYLPKAENSFDFVILGSKTGFWAMILCAAALAILAAVIIIKSIRKNRK